MASQVSKLFSRKNTHNLLRCIISRHLIVPGLFAAGSVLTTPASVSAEERDHQNNPTLNIALLGDSVTRGVIAEKPLGSTANLNDYATIGQMFFNRGAFAFIPEQEGVLNWSLMLQSQILARDHLAAVQGEGPASVATRLKGEGVPTKIYNVAQLGGSYRTADGQVALLQTALLEDPNLKSSTIDVTIVDLGRIDFSLFTEIRDFKIQVDHLFDKLLSTVPLSRFLVTRIADIPTTLDRPDRVGLRFYGGSELTCRQVFEGGGVAAKTRLVPGKDNSPYIAQAITRWQDMNRVISDKVATLASQGVTIEFINTIPDREPESWDQVLAADCIHLNEAGQSEAAGVIFDALQAILKRPPSNHLPEVTPESPQWPPEADQAWAEYIKTIDLDQIQEPCRPRIIREKAPFQGVAVLYHGYSACPQQFFELAEELTAKGYAVVLPLLPGHGRLWSESDGKKIDDVSLLPQGLLSLPNSYQTSYVQLAAQMNHLASFVHGQRVIAGLSTGGSLVSMATILRSDLWDRQLILSPLYELDPIVMRTLLGSINNTERQLSQLLKLWDPILDQELGWGQGCEDERDPDFVARYGRHETRAGFCQFKVTHTVGANQLGFEAWETLRPTVTKTQVIGVAQDPVINKQLIFNGVGRLRNENLNFRPYKTEKRLDQHPQVRVCYLPSDNMICAANLSKPLEAQDKPCVNHSLLSRYDAPQQNKYWITPLQGKIINFLASGEFFPADPMNRVHGDPICKGF